MDPKAAPWAEGLGLAGPFDENLQLEVLWDSRHVFTSNAM